MVLVLNQARKELKLNSKVVDNIKSDEHVKVFLLNLNMYLKRFNLLSLIRLFISYKGIIKIELFPILVL